MLLVLKVYRLLYFAISIQNELIFGQFLWNGSNSVFFYSAVNLIYATMLEYGMEAFQQAREEPMCLAFQLAREEPMCLSSSLPLSHKNVCT